MTVDIHHISLSILISHLLTLLKYESLSFMKIQLRATLKHTHTEIVKLSVNIKTNPLMKQFYIYSLLLSGIRILKKLCQDNCFIIPCYLGWVFCLWLSKSFKHLSSEQTNKNRKGLDLYKRFQNCVPISIQFN